MEIYLKKEGSQQKPVFHNINFMRIFMSSFSPIMALQIFTFISIEIIIFLIHTNCQIIKPLLIMPYSWTQTHNTTPLFMFMLFMLPIVSVFCLPPPNLDILPQRLYLKSHLLSFDIPKPYFYVLMQYSDLYSILALYCKGIFSFRKKESMLTTIFSRFPLFLWEQASAYGWEHFLFKSSILVLSMSEIFSCSVVIYPVIYVILCLLCFPTNC